MISSKEKRRFSRFLLPLTVRYQTLAPGSSELCQGEGVIRDISLSGSFFYLDHAAPFHPGQFLSLTIAAPLLFLDSDHLSDLSVTGAVVRLEPPGFANTNYGVAVNFIENLSFAVVDPPVFAIEPYQSSQFLEPGLDRDWR